MIKYYLRGNASVPSKLLAAILFDKSTATRMSLITVRCKKRRPSNIHDSFRFIILLAQCFALIPVKGIWPPQPTHLRFSKKSLRFVYAVLTLTATLFVTACGLHYMIAKSSTLSTTVSVIFYFGGFFTNALFLTLATKWPKLIGEWTDVDKLMMRNYGYPKRLNLQLRLTTVVVVLLATVEHLLSVATSATTIYYGNNATINPKLYYTSTFPYVFSLVQYTTWLAVLVQMVSILSTFTWSFNDLFIILVSIALVSRFKQITKRLRQQRHRINEKFWMEMREDYDRLSNLCLLVDSALSYIVLSSFGTNLFFIIIQLYNSLRIMSRSIEKVYFFYSFGFLILRTICVSLYAASINNESREPIAILNSVSSTAYNVEIQRFLAQLRFDNVALTGCKTFKVTGSLILYVAGAIVSYELVFIQFNNTRLCA